MVASSHSHPNPDVKPRSRVSTSGPVYPTSFEGATGAAGSSIVATTPIAVYGITVESATALGTVTIANHAGTTLITLLPTAAGVYRFPAAVLSTAGLAITVAGTAMQVTVHWGIA